MLPLLKKYIVEIIVALGGNIAVILIILRFAKLRIEKYLDTLIETKASEQLAKFESDLEKRKLYFEVSVAEEQELYKGLVTFYSKTIPLIGKDLTVFEKMLVDNKVFSSATSVFANCIELGKIVENESEHMVKQSVYLDTSINDTHKKVLQDLNNYILKIDSYKEEFDLPIEEKNKLRDNLKKIQDEINKNIRNIKKCIDKKMN